MPAKKNTAAPVREAVLKIISIKAMSEVCGPESKASGRGIEP
jgi:hypothetical protein